MTSTPRLTGEPSRPSAASRKTPLRFASSLAFLAAAGLVHAQTAASTTQPKTDDQVVQLDAYTVTSLRASLTSAQEIKQNSPELVDAIVAQDIGKLPDNTVADALQRVAGIQVSRAAGEANTVVIRGLPNLETTLNGYEVFTGTGRGVALQDIPAEMLASVDAYKTVGPDKIEGGVAGLIDVRLRRPFDFKTGLTTAVSARGIYADQARKSSYLFSGLASNHVKLASGAEFGVLVDLSYSRRRYEDQVVDNFVHFGANGETFDIATDGSGTPGYYADNFGWQIRPGDRKRPAASVMLQFKTASGVEFYWDNLYTGYRDKPYVDFFIGIPSWGGYRTDVTLYPAGAGGWNNDGNHDGQPDRFVKSFVAHDTVTLTSTQAFDNSTDTYQGAFGSKWGNDRLKMNAEASYNVSTVKTRGVILDTGITSPTQALAISYNNGTAPTVQASGVDYTNGNNFFLTQFYDQWSRAHSDQYALKLDTTFWLDSQVAHSIQVGVRYANRDVNFHANNPGGTFVWQAAQAKDIPGLGSASDAKMFLPASQFSIRNFWSANPGWLLTPANQDKLRTIFGRSTGLPAADLGSTFTDTEEDDAAYVQLNYKLMLGSMPLEGVIGARGVGTQQRLGGYQHPTIIDPVTGSASQAGYFAPVSNKRNRTDLLPTVNGRLKLTDSLFLRGAFTQTITRPNFGDLNPALTLTQATLTVPGSGGGGNPDLAPIKSTNYDLSLEQYFSKTTSVSVAGFYRSFDGYVQSYSSAETIDGRSYNVTRPRNTRNGYLQGAEATYQQFFDFLPDALRGLGVQANYTYIDGKTENPLTNEKQTIAQVSRHNYNAILIYERGPVSARLAYTWRGRYIESFNQPGLQPTTVWVQPRGQLDFSLGFDLTKNVTLTLDATNLTGSKYHDNFGNLPMFSRDVRSYDRTYEVGIRARF